MPIFKWISNLYTRLHIARGNMTYWQCTKCDFGFFGSLDGTT